MRTPLSSQHNDCKDPAHLRLNFLIIHHPLIIPVSSITLFLGDHDWSASFLIEEMTRDQREWCVLSMSKLIHNTLVPFLNCDKIPWTKAIYQRVFILTYGSRGRVHNSSGAWKQVARVGNQQITFPSIHRKQRQGAGSEESHSPSKPSHSDVLPPARHYVFHNLPKQSHSV